MIRKRKRNAVPIARQDQVSCGLSGAGDQARFPSEVFRKYFEVEFEPLPDPRRREKQTTALINSNVTIEDTDTDWSGLSDDESQLNVQVVEHSSLHRVVDTDGDKVELKSFMTSKPPTLPPPLPKSKTKTSKDDEEDQATNAANLKKDLALQRLLKESHLLDSPSASAPSGQNRHKATDLRLRSLGSKASVFEQNKMPMSHRNGIRAKASRVENTRRQDALENGIVLERSTKLSKPDGRKRERAIGAPSIGKFSGGTLKLSQRDMAQMKGPRRGMRGGRRG